MATYQATSSGRICATIRLKSYPSISKTFRTKALAKAWVTRTEADIRDGVYHDGRVAKTITLSAVLDQYLLEIVPLKKTARFHQTNIRTLKKYLGNYKLHNITPQVIVKFVTERSESVSSSSIRKEVNTLNHVIKTAIALWSYPIKENPVAIAKDILSVTKVLTQSKPRSRRLSDGEEKKLLDGLSDAPVPKLLTLLTLETARRLGELLRIQSEDIVIRSGSAFLRVLDSKTGDAFTVPLSDRAKELLPENRGTLFSIQSNSVSQAFNRAVKRAELIDLRLTDLRHEALSRLFERGFSVPEVMAISGHRSPDVLLKVYANVLGSKVSDKLNQAAKS